MPSNGSKHCVLPHKGNNCGNSIGGPFADTVPHYGPDDAATSSSGNSGSKIAFDVIKRAGPSWFHNGTSKVFAPASETPGTAWFQGFLLPLCKSSPCAGTPHFIKKAPYICARNCRKTRRAGGYGFKAAQSTAGSKSESAAPRHTGAPRPFV